MKKQLFIFWVLSLLMPWQIMSQALESDTIRDLSGHNFEDKPVLFVDGTWEFYWDQLIEPGEFSKFEENKEIVDFPFLWTNHDYPSFGAATFRIVIQLPNEHHPLSMIIPDAYSSYRLYINGSLFAENGNPALTKKAYTPAWNHTLKSLNQLPGPLLSNQLELVLQVANFDHHKGGTSQQLLLGTTKALTAQKTKELAYSWTLTGGLLLAAMFFLGLFAYSSKDKSILYFALFCFIYTYRVIGFGVYPLHDLFPNLPWIITLKLEYLSLFASVFFFGLYTYYLYPKETSKLLLNILSSICLIFIFLTLFFPPHIFTLTILPFFIILGIYIVYAVYIYTMGLLHKKPGSGFALASTVVLFIIFLYQIIHYFGFVKDYLILTFSGQLLFILLQSQILSYRFTRSLNEARKKAEAASKAKSEFLSTMSHEIRTPLNAVIGFSDLLDDGTLNEEKKSYTQHIQLSGKNLLRILNDILDYSKIESRRLDIEYSQVNPHELVEEVIEQLTPLVKKKKIKLTSNLQDELPLIFSTDKTRLQQVLINLTDNAIKFTDKGSVTIFAGLNKDSSYPGNICFEVRDTGIGVGKKDIEKLFKRFSQVDSGNTRRHAGTGLGLAISKEIVEALGGEIHVQSDPGNETVFTFTIEAELASVDETINKSEEKSPASSVQHPPGQPNIKEVEFEKLKVLIAEDNEINQLVTMRILERLGIKADLAKNGEQAVNLALTTYYDLIFMDMQMPVVDGVEATKQIRNNEESLSQKSTVVALTANATSEAKALCFEAGMNDFMGKPMTIESTEQIVKKWVSIEPG